MSETRSIHQNTDAQANRGDSSNLTTHPFPANGQEDSSKGRICPACGGPLEEIRAKLQCQRCHTIVETCCEGGPQ